MIYEFNGYKPVIDPSSFIHKEATIIGNVIIGKDVYVGPGASIRGDWGQIIIKDGCNIQDNCIVHIFPGKDVVLQESAHIGHGAIIHGAQIGKNVHLSGGVGIGGVLEPLQASPVIVEDGAFIGSRSIVVEGAKIGKEAVLGANVVVTKSTRIIDVTESEPKTFRGEVPARSVVIPGNYTKEFNAGAYQVPCALIIGKRSASTDLKTSLNAALREYDLAV